jgi:hypothetical protein
LASIQSEFTFHQIAIVSTGTLHKNVTLVQKSSKTSVEQSFFVACPWPVETKNSFHQFLLDTSTGWQLTADDGA